MNKQGFTLIEIIVVTSIIGLLMSLSLASFSDGTGGTLLESDAVEIKSTIKKAENNTITGLENINQDSSGSYGLYFSTNTPKKYYFYLDKNKDKSYNLEEKIFEYNLTNSEIDGFSTLEDNLDILFYSENADLYINGEVLEDNLTINLKDGNNIFRYININRFSKVIDITK
ncbi:type II secretion system GspH family protein [Patescibacteria group bacterium]|nr:type II secretion system GspH family protein [Patescibacteria group bacterium]